MVCVDYGDFLDLTLDNNKRHFDNIVVVTVAKDQETIKVCEKHKVKHVFTDRLYENGDRFNKGKAINDGIAALEKKDWVLITDADMIMAPDLRQVLEKKNLNDQCIYGTSRFMCPDYKGWMKYLRNPDIVSEWEHQRNYKAIGVGFFQLVNFNCDILMGRTNWYSERYDHCGRSDRMFLRQWPDEQRGRIKKAACIHLGNEHMSVNWYGRVTARFR